jgi:hypothetical protein
MFISDKVDTKPKLVRRDKDHFLLIKGTTHQEEVKMANIYVPNAGAPSFIKQILLDLIVQIDHQK